MRILTTGMRGFPVFVNRCGVLAGAGHPRDGCQQRFGPPAVASPIASPPLDVAWLALDTGAAQRQWRWTPATPADAIFEEIAAQAEREADWMEASHA